jgi:two-component system response regulator YesN
MQWNLFREDKPMVKIMLVEDEPAVLNGIKNTLSFLNEVEVIGAAFSGPEALKLLESIKPDLLITDIRMPRMTGLELIRQVNEHYPEIHCVLLSGFSEFEYAREALRLKVMDYLLKPVSIEKLAEIVGIVQQTIDEKARKDSREIIKRLTNSTEPVDVIKASFLNQYPYYHIVHICVGPMSIPSLDLIFPDLNVWNEEVIYDRLIVLFENGKQLYVIPGKISNEKWVIFGIDTNDIEPVRQVARRLMAHLMPTGLPVTLSICEPFTRIEDLSKHARKIRDNAFKKVVIGVPRVLLQIDQEEKHEHWLLSNQDEQLLKKYAEKKSFASIKEFILDLFEKWKTNCVTEIMCAFGIKQILSSLIHDMDKKIDQETLNDLFYEVDILVSSSCSFKDLYEGTEQLIQSFLFKKKDLASSLNIRQSIDQIEAYVFDHYAEPLSNEKLSEIFGYNPIYLSSTFCCIKGISPNKLIKKVRVDKAKTLLVEHPDMLLKDVAQIAGYDDALYFSRVFKSMTDMSPSEYRKNEIEQPHIS